MLTHKILFVLICIGFLSFSSCHCYPDPQSPKSTTPKWNLVWSDEFENPGLPDPSKWIYEEGFIRNREAQYYTVNRLKNARVEDGKLIIEAHRESFLNPKYKSGSEDWRYSRRESEFTSACLITSGIASWKYGRIEVSAKLPQGQGVWPAIWAMGDTRGKVRHPFCGEIDIMEFVGHTPNRIWGTFHYPNNEGKTTSQGGHFDCKTLHSQFHLYAIEWFEDRIDLYFDETLYYSMDLTKLPDSPFHQKFYLLINLAMGGGWGKQIDNDISSCQFQIDYVRVYQIEK